MDLRTLSICVLVNTKYQFQYPISELEDVDNTKKESKSNCSLVNKKVLRVTLTWSFSVLPH